MVTPALLLALATFTSFVWDRPSISVMTAISIAIVAVLIIEEEGDNPRQNP